MDVDAPLIVFLRIPGVESAWLERQLRKISDGTQLVIEDEDPHEQVKKITLQEAREIGFISSRQPVGFHRLVGSPLPDKPLPHDGLFTGREVFNVALVDHPMAQLNKVWRNIKGDCASPHWKQAGALCPREFVAYLHEADPQMTDNRQCFHLSTTGERTFVATQSTVAQHHCLFAPRWKSPDVLARVAETLGKRPHFLELIWGRLNLKRLPGNALIPGEPFDFVKDDMSLYGWADAEWVSQHGLS